MQHEQGPGPSWAGPRARTTPRKAAIRSATDDKIARAVVELIRRDGLEAVTIDGVAAHSGVAKTTIYRRYEDRHEMLQGVAQHLSDDVLTVYEPTRDGLAELVHDIHRVFEKRVGVTTIGALLASRVSSLQGWRDRIIGPPVAALTSFFSEGVAAGALADDIDYDHVVELILGGMFVRATLRGDVPEGWSAELVDLLWPRIAVPDPAAGVTRRSAP